MFLLPTLIDCGTFIAPQCSGAWFWCAIRCGHFVVLSMTGASKPRQESAAAVCEQMFARRVELLHRSRSSGKLQARTWQKLRIPKRRQEACRAPGFASHASPTLAALRLAHEHTRAQHASTRTLHACEPRQRRAHALTQQHALAHAQKHSVVPRVTGHWLTVGRPAAEPSSAQSQRKCTRHISLLTSHVHHPHAVHATHHHCCVATVRRE